MFAHQEGRHYRILSAQTTYGDQLQPKHNISEHRSNLKHCATDRYALMRLADQVRKGSQKGANFETNYRTHQQESSRKQSLPQRRGAETKSTRELTFQRKSLQDTVGKSFTRINEQDSFEELQESLLTTDRNCDDYDVEDDHIAHQYRTAPRR